MIQSYANTAFVTIVWSNNKSTVFGPFTSLDLANEWIQQRTPKGYFVTDDGQSLDILCAIAGKVMSQHDDIITSLDMLV